MMTFGNFPTLNTSINKSLVTDAWNNFLHTWRKTYFWIMDYTVLVSCGSSDSLWVKFLCERLQFVSTVL